MLAPFMIEFSGTPEAGKTTAITRLTTKLRNNGYNVCRLVESAEMLPCEIPKGTVDANLWMHFTTQAQIIRAQYFGADVLLIDRGIVDSRFYGEKYFREEKYSKEQYHWFLSTIKPELYPGLFIGVIVEPEVAIKRKGGNGHLINLEYLRKYNTHFLDFYERILIDKELVDTTSIGIDEMCDTFYDLIVKHIQ